MRGGSELAKLIGFMLVLGLVVLVLKWALITAAILIVPFGIWWIWDRTRTPPAARVAAAQMAARRRQLEALAVVDTAGGCGWCGSRDAHRDHYGGLVYPLDYHRADIERFLHASAG